MKDTYKWNYNIKIKTKEGTFEYEKEYNENVIATYFNKINKNKDKETEELQKELEEYKQIGIMQFNRPYAKRYLEEKKKEIPNLMYPDSETIYEEYYNLKDRINKAIEYINTFDKGDYISSIKILDILKGSDKE